MQLQLNILSHAQSGVVGTSNLQIQVTGLSPKALSQLVPVVSWGMPKTRH